MVRMSGVGGEVRYGYAVAARLKRWKIENETLEAPDAEIDPFWGEEEGERSLHITMGGSVYVWENVVVDTLRPTLTVRVPGTPERRRL